MTANLEYSAFENHSVMPAQFFPGRPDDARIEPMRRLAFAVLADAVHVFQTHFNAIRIDRRRQFKEASEWLFGPPGDGPFAFDNVCYMAGVDPLRIRGWLLQWQAMKRAGHSCRTVSRRTQVGRRRTIEPSTPRRRRRAPRADQPVN